MWLLMYARAVEPGAAYGCGQSGTAGTVATS